MLVFANRCEFYVVHRHFVCDVTQRLYLGCCCSQLLFLLQEQQHSYFLAQWIFYVPIRYRILLRLYSVIIVGMIFFYSAFYYHTCTHLCYHTSLGEGYFSFNGRVRYRIGARRTCYSAANNMERSTIQTKMANFMSNNKHYCGGENKLWSSVFYYTLFRCISFSFSSAISFQVVCSECATFCGGFFFLALSTPYRNSEWMLLYTIFTCT